MATSESPRAMVLVNAVMSTLTAFSQGELPCCAKAGAARRSTRQIASTGDRSEKLARQFRKARFMRLSLHRSDFKMRGALAGRAWDEDKGKEDDCEGRLFAPVCRTFSSGHTWSVRSVTASGPQSRPCLPRPHARPSQRPMRAARHWSAGVTGENSPHYTNLSTKRKIDRVLAKYFCRSTEMAKTRANDGTEENSTRGENTLSQRILIAPS